ncbi:hypothetical protein [Delftia sp. K82]|uniref:hypothetical protein n=1 Tax=Delftia sp. K82 TaxID=1472718 RepID=UPI0011781262|nr:hypothetical protein [Delftia sp. K82]
MQTTQISISQPVVERYVRRLEAGDVAPPIKFDEKIVDGHHRYMVGRVVGKEPAQTPGALSPRQITKINPIQNLEIKHRDW